MAAAVALAGVGLAAFAFLGGDDSPAASGTPTPTASPEPGEQTGTITPEPAPNRVACDAEAPEFAGVPKPQFAGPPPEVIEPKKTYTATIVTSCGRIVVELLVKRAPATVNSFVFLAGHGYFDGQYFHRLDASIDVIQGGDPTGTGLGGPGYTIPDEITGDEEYVAGTLAMANAGPGTGGSQFFLITGERGLALDPSYTIFGKVVKGLDVSELIQQLPIQDPRAGLAGQQPKQAVYIEKVTISVGK